MNVNSKSGSGCVSAFFVILFLASIALNAAFLTGCVTRDGLTGKGPSYPDGPRPTPPPTSSNAEATYLREIATSLGLSPSSDKTPGDIASAIQQALGNSQKFRGEVLSDSAFRDCKDAIPTIKDTETFEAYHSFIKKVAGKRILILDN